MTARPVILTDIEHSVVISRPGADRIPAGIATARRLGMRSQHYGWPGITKTNDGDILVSASERVRHVDPFGREVVCRSTDNGRTWSGPQVVFDSNTDDRDAAVCTLPDGTIVLTWFSAAGWTKPPTYLPDLWDAQRRTVKDDTLAALYRGWLRRSKDGGHTWEERVYPTIVGQHAGPTVLADGSLLYCGPYEGEKFVATRSEDGGKTWGIIGMIPCDLVADNKDRRRTALNENHCLEIVPGHILCALRATNEPRNIFISKSRDGGRAWTTPRDLGVYGFPPSLLQLGDGTILCIYGDRRDPRAIRAIVSRDKGVSWETDHILTIREFEHAGDMGYPRAIEIAPNEVLCVYYYIPHTSPDEPCPADHVDPAETGILATRFRVEA